MQNVFYAFFPLSLALSLVNSCEQVCRKLGIIEVDYFGLQFSGSKGENLWLNLRNRISQQMDNLTPCRLRLRVKFFVEPHLILQEQTRYIHTKTLVRETCIKLDCFRKSRTFHHCLWVEIVLNFRFRTEKVLEEERQEGNPLRMWVYEYLV